MENGKRIFLDDYFSDFYKNFLMEAGSSEPVLVITKKYDFQGCTGFGYEPRPRDYTLDTTIQFGVLPESEPFAEISNNGQILKILTTKSIWWRGSKKLELETKPITVGLLHTLGKNLSQPIYSPDPRLEQEQVFAEKHEKRRPDLPLEIIVGHEKIQRFLMGLVRYWTADMYWVEYYIRSIRMAGLTEVELLPQIKDWEERKKENIVSQLMRLMESNDLKNAKELVEEAIELKMHETHWIKTMPERPGISINVPEFIRGFAKTLQRPLAKEKN